MAKETSSLAPWDNEKASDWLASFDPWLQTIRLVHGSLQLDPQKNPQEVRAAAAMVILCCRENLWPAKNNEELDKIMELAVRQLSTIKQMYEIKARSHPEMMTNKKYRDLLTSIDQEIRLLEARMSHEKPPMPNTPPCTWGHFWD